MGWRDWFSRREAVASAPVAPRHVFSTSPLADLISQAISQTGPVSRSEALSVPALARGRNEICAIGTLPLRLYDTNNRPVASPLFRQWDPDVANSVHLAQTIEDLLFYGTAWWRIVGYGWDGFPAAVRRVDPLSVSVTPPAGRSPAPLPSGIDPRGGVVYIDGYPLSGADVIRFDSPNPGVLDVGADAIRRARLLDKAAKTYAEAPAAAVILRPVPGAAQVTDDEANAYVERYISARRKRSVMWAEDIEALEAPGPTPAQIQLVELQKQSALEIANLVGLDPEELGISTTQRTYKNINERRIDKVNGTLAPFMSAITDRLNIPANVFPPEHTAKFDLSDYLKADALDRVNVQKTYVDMGVLDPEEVRAQEGLPPGAPEKPQPDPVPAPDMPQEQDMSQQAERREVLQFAERDVQFVALQLQNFTVDTESRVIEGLAVPYGAVGNNARFEKGALKWDDVSRVKLNLDHDPAQTVGVMTAAKDGSDGLRVKFRIARTPEGDKALVLAEDRVYDGLSIEIPKDTPYVPDPRRKSGVLFREAQLIGVALTPSPAFTDARLSRVKFEEEAVADTDNETQSQEPVAVPAQFTDDEAAKLRLALPALEQFAALGADQKRAVVNPVRPVAATQVSDPQSYRFDRAGNLQPAAYDFAADLIAAAKFGRPDMPEHRRAMEFMRHQFNVATTDVNELNPSITLPRFIDEMEYTYPLYAATNKGTPPNGVNPFRWPIYSSASGLVAAHSEGSEPSTGSYVTSEGTVTPTAMSGKARINREAWDMGGTPGLSDLVWRKIRRSWYEAIEGGIEDTLTAASPTSLGTFTTGGGTDHQTLVAELRRHLAALQFARGGFRFTDLFAEYNLYRDLIDAVDDSGRPIFPATGPQNADGTVGGRWASINVNGVTVSPAWALGAVASSSSVSSYLIDRSAVDSWATEPQRLDMTNVAVAYVDIGVWGYHASVINDSTGVREVIYDSVT